MNGDPVQDLNGGWDWINRIPFGQLFSLMTLVAFVVTAVFSLLGLDAMPAGTTPGPIAQAWPSILIWSLTAGVLHQAVKIWKGGPNEVDQQ